MSDTVTLSQYLLHRLKEAGIDHAFGVPGDYVLDFLDALVASPIRWVGTCNELNAGYAADGYARLKGAGVAVVTYGVGGLSILNAVAGAYAERVPLIVISGAPPARRREVGAMVHHLVANYDLQLEIFRKVTTDAAILADITTAPDEIDRIIRHAVQRRMPVYLELPADMARAVCRVPEPISWADMQRSDDGALRDSVAEATRLINDAARPLILAGIELLRFDLGPDVLRLVETAELPYATMLSSKCVLPELHPQFVGLYQGSWSREAVRRQVESSDCLLSLGVWMTDLDTGLFSINLESQREIVVGGNQVRTHSHEYNNVGLADFIRALLPAVRPRSYVNSHPVAADHNKKSLMAEPSRPLSAIRLYDRLDHFLDDSMILLVEPGDVFCAAPDFHIEEARNFIVQAYYSSIGYCTPAALGVALARPSQRPVILTGDGAFQMTAQEISTLIRQRCPAIVLLINNDGYLIERVLHEDGPYNDIARWDYSRLPAVLGGGQHAIGVKVTTEGELESALHLASTERDKLVFIELDLPKRDCSAGLTRLGKTFRAQPK